MRFLLLLCLASTSCIFRSPNCDDDVLFTIQDGTYTSSMSALRGTVNSSFSDPPVGDITLVILGQTASLSYINTSDEVVEVVMSLGELGTQFVTESP